MLRHDETVFDPAVGAGAGVVRREIWRVEVLCLSPCDQRGREDSEDGASLRSSASLESKLLLRTAMFPLLNRIWDTPFSSHFFLRHRIARRKKSDRLSQRNG
jgi:hypothetical protein